MEKENENFWQRLIRRWRQSREERRRRELSEEIQRRLQIRECWGTLYISFDNQPLLCDCDLDSRDGLCDLLDAVRGNMESYWVRKGRSLSHE